MGNYKFSNKDFTIFLLVNLGLVVIMGFAMSYAYSLDLVGGYPLVHMYYPALGVMIALILNKEIRNQVPKEFFGTFMFFSITSIIYLLIKTLIFHQDPTSKLQTWLMFGSISLLIVYFADREEKIERFGLKISKKHISSILCVLLFLVLYMGRIFLSSLLFGELKEALDPFKNIDTWISLILLPISFPLSFMLFLGEEYGWRYFLQPALQERLGTRLGIIVLGLIWGIWHLPINIFYYSPTTSLYSILNQLIVCISYSIFFGFVYMKTENIWAIAMIHFINNNLAFIIYGGTGNNLVFSWKSVVYNFIFLSIFYLPFLFTKEYSKRKNNIEKSETIIN